MKTKHPSKRQPDSYKHIAIRKAATRLFLKHGYAQTSMDAIAHAANVTKQTVYAHFHSKDALFSHMITELSQQHEPSDFPDKDHNLTPDELLYKVGIAFINIVTSKDGLAATRLVVSESINHPKLARYYYESGTKRIQHMLAEWIEVLNRKGTLHISNTLSAASYFFAMLKGNYYLRILLNIKPLPSAKEKEAHVRECVSVFMRVYGGKNPMHTGNEL